MVKSVETAAVALAPITPLSSTIRTFVGRDENGPLYTRLDFFNEQEQAGFALKILKGLIAHLATTDPEYAHRLHSGVESHVSTSSIGPDSSASDTVLIDATDKTSLEVARNEYSNQLQAKLTVPNSIYAVADTFYKPSILNRRTGQISPAKLNRYLSLATDEFRDDPLIQLSHEAAKLLAQDDLRQLGRFTVGAAAAVVEYAGIYNAVKGTAQPGDPNAAA